MRRLLAFLGLIAVVAAGAYGVTRYLASRRPPEDQWTWLRHEFDLTDAQLARVRALHEAYQPVCAGHCSRIMAAQARLDALTAAGKQDTAEYRATLDQWEAVRRECNAATRGHLEAVAAVMSPAEGRRYLAMMEPRIATRDHLGPLGVR